MQMITIVGGCAIKTTTYFECGDQRNDLAVKPTNFCNSLIFGEKRLQKRASGFLLNKDGDLLEQPVGSDRSSELEDCSIWI